MSNRSGGIQGGISNGEDIVIRIAFKPTSTIGINQKTVTREGKETELRARGRHDPCVVPRAVPMVESMVAIVLADQLLQVGSRHWSFVMVHQHAWSISIPPLPEGLQLGFSLKHASSAQPCALYCQLLNCVVCPPPCCAQHYGQCELLPRNADCLPDSKVATQFAAKA